MNDINHIFEEGLNNIIDMVGKSNYRGCARVSHDSITTFSMMGFADGIFIYEILDGVFSQINQIMRLYIVDEKSQIDLGNGVKTSINKIRACYNFSDKTALYNELRDLRVSATLFQLRNLRYGEQKATNSLPLSEISQILGSE